VETQVLVIGGGATGCGVARDAALRGLAVVLAERGDLAEGTSGRFHGLVHSGARYAVVEPLTARECLAENAVVRRVAASAVEATEGLFVTAPGDDGGYADAFLAGCRAIGIPAEEIRPGEVLRREPLLNPRLERAFQVPDAVVDVWHLVRANARDAERHGARILAYHAVERLLRDGDRVLGAVLRDPDGAERTVRAEIVVNATGSWAGRVAALGGCAVRVTPGRGLMIALNRRLTQTVVNRCAPPGDGDILVPIRTVSVIGTTDVPVRDPDDVAIEPDEVRLLLETGEALVPGLRRLRALRAWAGTRPLYDEDASGETRALSRAFAVIDHAQRDGVGGLVTVTGGKLTTYRLMAERAVDLVAGRLGGRVTPCTTATAPLPPLHDDASQASARLARRERALHDDQAICECELVDRRMLLAAFDERPAASLDDLRRAVRLGMGPCQGGFCIPRAAGVLVAEGRMEPAAANAAIRDFAEERWRGVLPILHGDGARQARLDAWLLQGLLAADAMPA
jgi:glycerol-3-phosphate dehydrogenase